MTATYFRIQNFDAAELLDGPQWSSSYSTGAEQSGKSVCESLEDLAAYIATTGLLVGEPGAMLIELEGELSDEEDEDAELGALLVHPTAIVSATPVEETDIFELIDAILEAA